MKRKLYSITIDGVQYNVTKASTEFVCERFAKRILLIAQM